MSCQDAAVEVVGLELVGGEIADVRGAP